MISEKKPRLTGHCFKLLEKLPWKNASHHNNHDCSITDQACIMDRLDIERSPLWGQKF